MKNTSFEAESIRLQKLILHRVNYLVRIAEFDPDRQVENICIDGGRLAQYHEASRLLKENRLMSRYEAARRAFAAIPNGFKTFERLHNYILRHSIECPARR